MSNELIGIEWEPQFTLLEHPNLPVDFRVTFNQLPPIDYPIRIAATNNKVKVYLKESVFLDYQYGKFPYSYYIDTDQVKNNLEARTRPVALSDLQTEIQNCNDFLHKFILKLKQHTNNGIGVFLPKAIADESTGIIYLDKDNSYKFLELHTPSKHVSISFKDKIGYNEFWCGGPPGNDKNSALSGSKEYDQLKSFTSYIQPKPSDCSDNSNRIHITVPYNFTAYQELIPFTKQLWTSNNNNWLERYIALAQYIDNWAKNNKQEKPLVVGYIKSDRYVKIGGLI
jgi:hypothetical protein